MNNEDFKFQPRCLDEPKCKRLELFEDLQEVIHRIKGISDEEVIEVLTELIKHHSPLETERDKWEKLA